MGKIIDPRYELPLVERLAIDQLQRAISQRNHPFRNLVFSTADANGPNARMVVLRKMSTLPFCLTVYTDRRSNKIAELKQQAMAVLLFWHPSARLQVKLRTEVQVHLHSELTSQAWKSIGEVGREAYNSVEAPGQMIAGNQWRASPLLSPMVQDHFTVLECVVNEMDVLQLSSEGHIRASFKYEFGKLYSAAFVHP